MGETPLCRQIREEIEALCPSARIIDVGCGYDMTDFRSWIRVSLAGDMNVFTERHDGDIIDSGVRASMVRLIVAQIQCMHRWSSTTSRRSPLP